ncbi:hypothetical protein AO263_32940 [Pseudomonas sp. NZIPFR-PS5]|nr:hypothetical protein AO263_32940 [Pseudomonas sp. NZIPFR-PS5]
MHPSQVADNFTSRMSALRHLGRFHGHIKWRIGGSQKQGNEKQLYELNRLFKQTAMVINDGHLCLSVTAEIKLAELGVGFEQRMR